MQRKCSAVLFRSRAALQRRLSTNEPGPSLGDSKQTQIYVKEKGREKAEGAGADKVLNGSLGLLTVTERDRGAVTERQRQKIIISRNEQGKRNIQLFPFLLKSCFPTQTDVGLVRRGSGTQEAREARKYRANNVFSLCYRAVFKPNPPMRDTARLVPSSNILRMESNKTRETLEESRL